MTSEPSQNVSTVGPPVPSVERSSVTGVPPESSRQRFFRRLRQQRLVMVMILVLLGLILVAVFAPAIAPYDPSTTDTANRFAGPSSDHWLGQDELGRDVLSRLIFGTRISLIAAAQAVALAVAIGVPLGLVSGYFGGKVDVLLMRLNDAVMSFPALILAIAIVGILGPGLRNAMTAIGVVFSPRIVRVVRGATLSVAQETYIEAARSLGCSPVFIMRKHVLPNVLSPLVVQITLTLGLAVLAEASLSFLGLGVQPPDASWGSILGRAFPFLAQSRMNIITPGICIMVVVLAFNIIGDGIRDASGRERRTE